MSPRTLTVWTAIVAALLMVYLWSSRPPEPLPDTPWISFTKDMVQAIDIQKSPETPLRLNRAGGQWMRATDTGNVPIDTGMVMGFLDMLLALRADYAVTDSPAKFGLFDLADTVPMTIHLGDSPSIILYAGKASPGGEFTYMRRAEESRIWAIRGFQEWAVRRLRH